FFRRVQIIRHLAFQGGTNALVKTGLAEASCLRRLQHPAEPFCDLSLFPVLKYDEQNASRHTCRRDCYTQYTYFIHTASPTGIPIRRPSRSALPHPACSAVFSQ